MIPICDESILTRETAFLSEEFPGSVLKFKWSDSRQVCVSANGSEFIFSRRKNGRFVLKGSRMTKPSAALCHEEAKSTCAICLESHAPVALTCGHTMCKNCVFSTCLLNRPKCPFCRRHIDIPPHLADEYYKQMHNLYSAREQTILQYEADLERMTRYRERFCRAWESLAAHNTEEPAAFRMRFRAWDRDLIAQLTEELG